MKFLIFSLMISFSLSLFALSIQEQGIKIPKITYKGLKKLGIDDSKELELKASLTELLKEPEMASKLKDPTEVDHSTSSLVREIEASSDTKRLRLLKNKARKIIFDYTKENWELLSQSTINYAGVTKFEDYKGFLVRDLNEKLYFTHIAKNEVRLEMEWIRLRMDTSKNSAEVIIQRDYLGDENEMTQQALRVKAKEGTSALPAGGTKNAKSSSKFDLF
ncbi:MAG: hypothetical protein VX642_08465 [Bdellovibrionota bacterium]|nr:hypothetical protein [Bdellovibrionota bacterium]